MNLETLLLRLEAIPPMSRINVRLNTTHLNPNRVMRDAQSAGAIDMGADARRQTQYSTASTDDITMTVLPGLRHYHGLVDFATVINSFEILPCGRIPVTKLRIFDFDGTLTDVEEEGRTFRLGYLGDLAEIFGVPFDDILAEAILIEGEIDPNDGWLYNGQIVAPATVDPYLRIMPVARAMFKKYWPWAPPAAIERLLDRILYKYNYPKAENVFRDEAFNVLLGADTERTWIVTNSATDAVESKVLSLGRMQAAGRRNPFITISERVRGNAKKYVNDPDWDGLPASMMMPGLDRPVLLRRELYWKTLEELRQKAGVEWSEIEVIGDIFELDLAVPLAMGCKVTLVANQFTPVYEIAFLTAHERGRVIYDLAELLD